MPLCMWMVSHALPTSGPPAAVLGLNGLPLIASALLVTLEFGFQPGSRQPALVALCWLRTSRFHPQPD
nr:hypothetical protein [Kibdelosporangium sp. MJ126-NF4]CTQ88958.1 hypothetical protein [Kibdelosporangium sp. MJ126-NF4]